MTTRSLRWRSRNALSSAEGRRDSAFSNLMLSSLLRKVRPEYRQEDRTTHPGRARIVGSTQIAFTLLPSPNSISFPMNPF